MRAATAVNNMKAKMNNRSRSKQGIIFLETPASQGKYWSADRTHDDSQNKEMMVKLSKKNTQLYYDKHKREA